MPLNPVLAPLGNYGGPTQTMALLPGSPAIDAGSSGAGIPATDQRGESRVGGVDIGAFESQGFTFTVVPGSTPQTSNIGTAFANPLAVTVTANNPVEPVDGGIVSFVANPAANGATAILLGSLGRHRGRPGRRHRRAQQCRWQLQRRRVCLGFVRLVRSDQHWPGLREPGREYDERFPRPGRGLLSLREAVGFANTDPSGSSTITFDNTVFTTPQTITLTGSQLELSNTSGTETITGPAAGVTVSGGGLSRVFQVDPCHGVDLGTDDHRRHDQREWRRPVQLRRHDHADRLHRQRQLRRSTAAACTATTGDDHADRLHRQRQHLPSLGGGGLWQHPAARRR